MPKKKRRRLRDVGQLSHLHAVGKKVQRALNKAKVGTHAHYAPGVMADLAKRYEVAASSLYKAVHFAKEYTDDQLAEPRRWSVRM